MNGLVVTAGLGLLLWLLTRKKDGVVDFLPSPAGQVIIHDDQLQVMRPDDPRLESVVFELDENLTARERISLELLRIDLDEMDVSADATAHELAAGIPYAEETARLMRKKGNTGEAKNLEGFIALARARLATLAPKVSGLGPSRQFVDHAAGLALDVAVRASRGRLSSAGAIRTARDSLQELTGCSKLAATHAIRRAMARRKSGRSR